MDYCQSEHFELRHKEPFIWLRTKRGVSPCSFDSPKKETKEETDKLPPRVIDDSKWHIIFREEFLEKRLLNWEGDLTDEAKRLLPQETKELYVLKTERLIRRFGNDVKSKGAFLLATPGEITAIMGPSGAGKSLFLKMICGYDRPSSVMERGEEVPMSDEAISICGDIGEDAFRHLGYVPQGDAMYPELTTRQSLRYRMKLKFGSLLTEDDITQCINHVCVELLRLKMETIEKQIGAMDWFGSYPSGGERRRINIAHELVLEPSVLILDEPTSGLSSSDSELVMTSLRSLATTKQICIVMTIHQPSDDMFKMIDDLLLFVGNGHLAYYGRRNLACEWLRQSPPEPGEKVVESKNEAETILKMIDNDVPSAKVRYPKLFEEFLAGRGGVISKIETMR